MIAVMKSPLSSQSDMPFSFFYGWANRTFIQLGLIAFCILFGTSLWLVHIIKNGVWEDALLQLQTIQNASHETMHYWRDMNTEVAISIANRPKIRAYILQLIREKPDAAALRKNPSLAGLRVEIQPLIKLNQYKGFFVVPLNQINYGSMRDSNVGQKNLLLIQDRQSLLQAFAGETVISKPVKSDIPLPDEHGLLQNNQYSMFIMTPITNRQNKIVALLMLRISPEESFKKILRVGRFGKSGESYVVNKEGVLLSPSRFDIPLMQAGLITPDTTSTYQLILKEPVGDITRGYRPGKQYADRPLTHIVKSTLQETYHADIDPVLDYRGVMVINIGLWDAHENLGFITQIDYAEAFAVYTTTRNVILLVTGFSGVLLALLIAFLINGNQVAQGLIKKRTFQLKAKNQSLAAEIEDRKKIEQILQNNQQRTEAILQSAFDAIIATDVKGTIELVNPATEKMFGYAQDELLSKNIKILIPEAISEKHDHLISQHESGTERSIVGRRHEMVSRRKDGSTFPIELAVEEMMIDGEKYFTSTINDITNRKEMMERLSASEREYKSIINNLNDTFYRTDINGRIVIISPSAEKLIGYRQDELIGLKTTSLYADPKDRKKFLRSLKANGGSIEDCEAPLQRKDGVVIWVSTNAHIYRDEYGTPLGIEGTARDVTEKKHAEEEIRESRQRLFFHIKQTPLGVIEWDVDFKVVEWNPAAEQIFGYSRNEAIGRHASEIIIPDIFKPHVDDIWHALLGSRGGQHSTNQNINKQGETVWCEWHNTPLVDDKMNVIGVASMVMDITSRKQATEVLARDHQQLQVLVDERTKELNKAKLEAEHANESKSDFLANMSHELRTPIHTILSFSEIGMKKFDKLSKEKLNQYFTNIHQGGERQLLLLNDLLDLSKLEAGTTAYEFYENDISQIIEEQLAQHELMLQNKHLKIIIQSTPLETKLVFDRIRIEQVVRNLLSNAIKFSEPNNTICIKLALSEIHIQHDSIPALSVTVNDNGIGIPDDELKSIFDKFVQSSKTRTGAGGTGLGLSICKEIITAHGGEIWAENNSDGGASFCFTLPILQADNATSESRSKTN